MTENPVLGKKLGKVITDNSFRETSTKTVQRLKNLNPLAVNRKVTLIENIQQKKITFRDALRVIREVGMMDFPDPKDGRYGTDATEDSLRLFIWNVGNAMTQNQNPEAEMQYIINDGVLNSSLRLPQVIEGVRQMILEIENNGINPYIARGEEKLREQLAKAKIQRLSNHLYALSDFQTDLIADEVYRIRGGKNWESVRKSVVKWGKNIQKELKKEAKQSVKLKSLLEMPVFTIKDQSFSPLDPMMLSTNIKLQPSIKK